MTEEAKPAPRSSGAGLFFDRVVQFLNGIGTLWILAILLLINADVFGRNLLHAPINGVIEMIEISMMPWKLSDSRFRIRSDSLIIQMPMEIRLARSSSAS